MDSKQEAKMNMYDAVLNHCNANPTIINAVPALQSAVSDFSDIFDNLKSAAQTEIQLIAGFAADKGEQRKTLVQTATDIAAQIFAYASATDNHILKGQVDYNFSDFNRLKDELLTPACNNVLAAANSNAVALVDYGITAAKITSLQTAINDFSSTVPAPRNAVSNRASASATIKNYIKDADELLEERLDKLVLQFKTSEQPFYDAYKSNRIILDAATSTTQLIGTVLTDGSSDPILNATVEVVGQSYSTTTEADGDYTLKIPIPGTYSIQFSLAGFATKIISNITITLGQTTTLNTTLIAQ